MFTSNIACVYCLLTGFVLLFDRSEFLQTFFLPFASCKLICFILKLVTFHAFSSVCTLPFWEPEDRDFRMCCLQRTFLKQRHRRSHFLPIWEFCKLAIIWASVSLIFNLNTGQSNSHLSSHWVSQAYSLSVSLCSIHFLTVERFWLKGCKTKMWDWLFNNVHII